MRLAWLTDIHLNFVSVQRRSALAQEIIQSEADAVLIGGDIAEAPSFISHLRALWQVVRRPIYFVLGNHDYYRGSITKVRRMARELCRVNKQIVWLPAAGIVQLTARTALVGHGCWGDARVGVYETSTILLNDYLLIQELRAASVRQLESETSAAVLLSDDLRDRLNELGDEAAEHFERVLPTAFDLGYDNVIALTHVAPFREAACYEGKISDDNWAPHFTCGAAGTAIVKIMDANTHGSLTVLCGHTHGDGDTRIRPNVRAITGPARYGEPAIQQIIDVD